MANAVRLAVTLAGPHATPFQRVEAVIKAQGWAIAGTCAAAGLAPSILAKARQRGGHLSLESIEAFARHFGVPTELLRTGTEPPPPVAAADADHRRVPLAAIRPSPLNPRKSFDAAALEELKQDLLARGLLQNLVLRPLAGGLYEIMAGERRWRALVSLEAERALPPDIARLGVPALVVDSSDVDALKLAIVENLRRQDVNAMEEAEGFLQLQALDPAMTNQAIALELGMSIRHVQLRLSLVTRLAPAVRDQLRAGTITLAVARALTSVPIDWQARILGRAGPEPTAQRLRDTITRELGLVPARFALFAAGAYDGPMHEDPETGQLWYADRGKFMAAQIRAVAARKLELEQHWHWVDEVRRFDERAYAELPSPAPKRARPGAVIVFDQTTGEVRIRENLRRRAQAPARGNPAFERALAERDRARALVLESIAAALQPLDACRLLLLGRMAPLYREPLAVRVGETASLFQPGAPLAGLASEIEAEPFTDRVRLKTRSVETAWEMLGRLDAGPLQQALVMSVGALFQATGTLSPLALDLAAAYGVPVPEIATLDDEQLADSIAEQAA